MQFEDFKIGMVIHTEESEYLVLGNDGVITVRCLYSSRDYSEYFYKINNKYTVYSHLYSTLKPGPNPKNIIYNQLLEYCNRNNINKQLIIDYIKEKREYYLTRLNLNENE